MRISSNVWKKLFYSIAIFFTSWLGNNSIEDNKCFNISNLKNDLVEFIYFEKISTREPTRLFENTSIVRIGGSTTREGDF